MIMVRRLSVSDFAVILSVTAIMAVYHHAGIPAWIISLLREGDILPGVYLGVFFLLPAFGLVTVHLLKRGGRTRY